MTRALILAAGQGTRLRPLTDDKPKCMVEFLGKSLLERQIFTLKSAGIGNIHVATGYRADQIEILGYPTSHNPKFASTNMVESLFSASEFFSEDEDLIIAYGDIIYQTGNLECVLGSNSEIALMIDMKWRGFWALRLENPLDDAETLKINNDGNVTELGKKPTGYDQIEGQYTGLIKIRSDKIKLFNKFYYDLDRSALYDGKDFGNMYMTSFLQLMIDNGWDAEAVKVDNGWLEIDTVEDLELYENLARRGELKQFYTIED